MKFIARWLRDCHPPRVDAPGVRPGRPALLRRAIASCLLCFQLLWAGRDMSHSPPPSASTWRRWGIRFPDTPQPCAGISGCSDRCPNADAPAAAWGTSRGEQPPPPEVPYEAHGGLMRSLMGWVRAHQESEVTPGAEDRLPCHSAESAPQGPAGRGELQDRCQGIKFTKEQGSSKDFLHGFPADGRREGCLSFTSSMWLWWDAQQLLWWDHPGSCGCQGLGGPALFLQQSVPLLSTSPPCWAETSALFWLQRSSEGAPSLQRKWLSYAWGATLCQHSALLHRLPYKWELQKCTATVLGSIHFTWLHATTTTCFRIGSHVLQIAAVRPAVL